MGKTSIIRRCRPYFVILLYELVISPKDPNEFKFLRNLLKKLGVKSKVLSDEDIEDLGMSVLMKDVDRSDRISESDTILFARVAHRKDIYRIFP